MQKCSMYHVRFPMTLWITLPAHSFTHSPSLSFLSCNIHALWRVSLHISPFFTNNTHTHSLVHCTQAHSQSIITETCRESHSNEKTQTETQAVSILHGDAFFPPDAVCLGHILSHVKLTDLFGRDQTK